MEVSYEVRSRPSPWHRVMRLYGQPSSRSVHRGKSGLCIELLKQFFEVADLVQSRQGGTASESSEKQWYFVFSGSSGGMRLSYSGRRV